MFHHQNTSCCQEGMCHVVGHAPFFVLQMHLSVAGSVVWGCRHCFDTGFHVPALSCCQELMCHGVICWLPSLATYSQCRKKAMIVCECAKVRRLSSSFFFCVESSGICVRLSAVVFSRSLMHRFFLIAVSCTFCGIVGLGIS